MERVHLGIGRYIVEAWKMYVHMNRECSQLVHPTHSYPGQEDFFSFWYITQEV